MTLIRLCFRSLLPFLGHWDQHGSDQTAQTAPICEEQQRNRVPAGYQCGHKREGQDFRQGATEFGGTGGQSEDATYQSAPRRNSESEVGFWCSTRRVSSNKILSTQNMTFSNSGFEQIRHPLRRKIRLQCSLGL
jgi:hypothetical protein